jgi:hypothetical protein
MDPNDGYDIPVRDLLLGEQDRKLHFDSWSFCFTFNNNFFMAIHRECIDE